MENWVERKTPQGRSYFCNLITQETTWDHDEIDPETGHLVHKKQKKNLYKNLFTFSLSYHRRKHKMKRISVLSITIKKASLTQTQSHGTNSLQILHSLYISLYPPFNTTSKTSFIQKLQTLLNRSGSCYTLHVL